MMRERTIREQILPVLDGLRRHVRRGVPVAQACQTAIHARSRETGLTYQTIVDGFRRRLALSDIAEFHRLVESWLDDGIDDLKNLVLRSSEARAHALIEDFFKKTERPSRFSAGTPAVPTGMAESLGTREMRGSSITIDDLDADVVAALRDRADRNHRTLNQEIRSILSRVARPDRAELGAWSADMRRRLRGRYLGDATAEIRADRER